MILSSHALTGAVIGKNINNPWSIVFISLIVHFLLDSLPHGEYLNQKTLKRNFWKVVLDLFIGFSLIIFYVYFNKLDLIKIRNIFIGAFVSLFPDLLTFLYWALNFKFLKKISDFHSSAHLSGKREWNLKNASNDIIVIATAIFLLLI